MIQLSSLLPAMPHGPVRPGLRVSGGASSFALALGALAPRVPTPGDDAAVVPGRQSLAAAGKDLPEFEVDTDGDVDTDEKDAPEDGADIAFAWFAVVPAPEPVPVPPGVALAAPAVEAKEPTALPVAEADCAAPGPSIAEGGAEIAGPVAAEAVGTQPVADAKPRPGTDAPDLAAGHPAPQGLADTPVADLPIPKAAAPDLEPVRQAEAPDRPIAGPQATGQLRTASPTPAAVPAAAAFGPAIEAATAAAAPAVTVPLRRAQGVEPTGTSQLSPAPDAAPPHAVAGTADIQQDMVDTRRQEWMGKMVAHIEALRDAAPVRETRLSLAPEALGKVEVSIRHDGDRVHVHFATETQAARQLIVDAQPRLSELAEARGLKLGQTSFESGTAGQGPHRDGREQPGQPQSLKPRPAYSETAVGAADDDRIA